MQFWKKATVSVNAVIQGILFIGFTVQIILGMIWLCCNFLHAQDFGEPDSALYRWFSGVCGAKPGILYLLQLALAFGVGYAFLRTLCQRWYPAASRGKAFAAWGSLALLTYPFAMQCHLAILPDSFIGSLFLLMLLFLHKPGGWRKRLRSVALAVLCAGLMTALSGVADADRNQMPGRSIEAVLASRVAWPTLWIDHEGWPEELREITRDVLYAATYCPGNMALLQAAVEDSVGTEAAKVYYRQMAELSWQYHAPMVVRQIGWDVLGYAATPVVFGLQLEGEAYDSYTGGNYERMRGNTPILTRYYVEYGCWWFCCCLALSAVYALFCIAVRLFGTGGVRRLPWKKWAVSGGICIFVSGVLIGFLTMRGAGLMDYKRTIAVNELWLIGALLFTGHKAFAESLLL